MALSDHVSDFNASNGCGGGVERLEAHHWTCDPFDEPMVLLEDVVEIFDLSDRD